MKISRIVRSLFAALLLLSACGGPKDQPVKTNPAFNADPAIRQLTEDIAKDPANASLYYQRGGLLERLREDTLALNDYKTAAKLDSTKAIYFSAVGDLLYDHKDITGAIGWIQKAIMLQPDEPRAHLKIANLFLTLQQYDNAFKELNIVLKKDPYNPQVYFLKGMIYKDMKDTPRAISNFQTALEVVPDYKDAVIQLGLIYSAKKDSLALKYLDRALKIDTNDVTPIFDRAVFYQTIGDTPRAKLEYRRCIIKNTQFIKAYYNLGRIYMEQDSIEKAFRQFDLVTKLEPTNPAAHHNRGVCNEMLGNVNEAILDYKKALVLDTGYVFSKNALKRLGVAGKKHN